MKPDPAPQGGGATGLRIVNLSIPLKGCPFCGHDPICFIADPGAPFPGGYPTIACGNECEAYPCPAFIPESSKYACVRECEVSKKSRTEDYEQTWKELAELWNTRTPNTHAELLEALREATDALEKVEQVRNSMAQSGHDFFIDGGQRAAPLIFDAANVYRELKARATRQPGKTEDL